MTETVWPAKPEIVTAWSFTEKGLGLDKELSSKALRDWVTRRRTVEGPKVGDLE